MATLITMERASAATGYLIKFPYHIYTVNY